MHTIWAFGKRAIKGRFRTLREAVPDRLPQSSKPICTVARQTGMAPRGEWPPWRKSDVRTGCATTTKVFFPMHEGLFKDA
jgi:hypothetical protein